MAAARHSARLRDFLTVIALVGGVPVAALSVTLAAVFHTDSALCGGAFAYRLPTGGTIYRWHPLQVGGELQLGPSRWRVQAIKTNVDYIHSCGSNGGGLREPDSGAFSGRLVLQPVG